MDAVHRYSSNGKVDSFYFALLFLINNIQYTSFPFKFYIFFSTTNLLFHSLLFCKFSVLLQRFRKSKFEYLHFHPRNVQRHAFCHRNALYTFLFPLSSSERIIISMNDFLLSSPCVARWIYRNGNKLTLVVAGWKKVLLDPLRPKSEILRARRRGK